MAVEPGSGHEVELHGGAEAHHTAEPASVWGWHADLGKLARIGGWISVISLLLMVTSTHYNGAGAVALIFFAALIVIGLLWDIQHRRTSWRN